jgi:flavin-dependent dehydrogenase
MSDVTIIGGGPAGSMAGYALAKMGWDVTLIEQHRFPRDKVCGESLSALGIDVLERLGLAGRVEMLGVARLTHTGLHAIDGRNVTLRLPREMWGISRGAMDRALIDAAAEAGVRVLQPARCESMTQEEGRRDAGITSESRRNARATRNELLVRYLGDNQLETLQPTWVILADGKGALLPKRPQPTTDFGIKAHFEMVEAARDAVELFGLRGHYVGVAPIEGGRFNLAFSLPAKRLEECSGDFDGLWRQLLRENVTLAERFNKARRVGDWLASPLPRFGIAREWPANVIPIGNAAAALEPIGGEGMGLAMRSGELAAGALDHAHRTRSPLPVTRLRSEFARLWQKRRFACRALARLFSMPTLAGSMIDWASGSEAMSREVLGWMGKDA